MDGTLERDDDKLKGEKKEKRREEESGEHEKRSGEDIWSGKGRRTEEMGEGDQKREHKLAIICQCRGLKKCSKSYSSKRQGQH